MSINVAFDIDGTIVDLVKFVSDRVDRFEKQTGLECKFTMTDTEAVKFDQPEVRDLFWKLYFEEYCSLQLSKSVVDSINQLYMMDCGVYFLSKRGNFGWGYDNDEEFIMELLIERWLKKNGIYFDRVVCTHGKSKTPWVLNLRINYLLDDSSVDLTTVPFCKQYIMSRPYNQKIVGKPRVQSIAEFIENILEDEEYN